MPETKLYDKNRKEVDLHKDLYNIDHNPKSDISWNKSCTQKGIIIVQIS